METKLIEVRDIMTTVVVLAVRMTASDKRERKLIAREGFNTAYPLVIFHPLSRTKATWNLYDWNDRTFQAAHSELQLKWDLYNSGDVLDVEYVLGETDTPKESDIQNDDDY